MESVNLIDRGGLNGIRVPEENILRFARNLNESTPRNETRFGTSKTNQVKSVHFEQMEQPTPMTEDSVETQDVNLEKEEAPRAKLMVEGNPGPPDSLKDNEPKVDDSIWTKIQTWFKNHTKLVTIIAIIIAVLIVVFASYTLYFRKTPSTNPLSRQSAMHQMSNFRTGESLVHRNKEL